ncbi:MAG: Mrp/NBP35 family ATP-binding protein [Firmicutes bacterium]|nr:Mrp/NBP35 family ATP-binding protein [Bacillota bacterium]
MMDQELILAKLKTVNDPELHKSIVDLHMVRSIDSETPGQVSVDIALTVAGCPLHERIEQEVKTALLELPDVAEVLVNLSVMNAEERKTTFAAAFGSSSRAKSTAEERKIGPLPGQTPPQGLAATKTSILGIASGKGGVGKSTVTANLAIALSRLGYRVGLMDLDIYGFSQGRMFGASGGANSNDRDQILPWLYHNVSLVSMGMFVPEDQAVIWRGPMLGKMMDQFFQDVAWPELDFLLIDLPPGTGDVALNVAQKLTAAKLIMVTTPQPVATHVARRAAEVALRARQPILGVIENMSYLTCPHGEVLRLFGEGGGQALADELSVPLLGQIPLEPEVRQGGDVGAPVTSEPELGPAGQVFLDIAQKIARAVGR